MSVRYKNVTTPKILLPMQNFTQEDFLLSPSQTTLNIIRQIAHTYRVAKGTGMVQSYCLN